LFDRHFRPRESVGPQWVHESHDAAKLSEINRND